jgi:hypothetical protein
MEIDDYHSNQHLAQQQELYLQQEQEHEQALRVVLEEEEKKGQPQVKQLQTTLAPQQER